MLCPDSYSGGLQQPVWLPFSANGKVLSGKFRILTQRTKTNAVTDGDDHGEVVLSE